jgi:hypothetical protein
VGRYAAPSFRSRIHNFVSYLTTNLFRANTTVEGRKAVSVTLINIFEVSAGDEDEFFGSQTIANVTVILSHFLSMSGVPSTGSCAGPR